LISFKKYILKQALSFLVKFLETHFENSLKFFGPKKKGKKPLVEGERRGKLDLC